MEKSAGTTFARYSRLSDYDRMPASSEVALDHVDAGPITTSSTTRYRGAELTDGGTIDRAEFDLAAVKLAWSQVLGRAPAGDDDSWNQYCADSLKMIEFLCAMENLTKRRLPLDMLSETMTPRTLAGRLSEAPPMLLPPTVADQDLPMLFVAQAIGLLDGPDRVTEALTRGLIGRLQVSVLRYSSIDLPAAGSKAFAQIVEEFAAKIVARSGQRPVLLLGHSFGAAVMLEVARILRQRGRPPQTLVLVDAELQGSEVYDFAGAARQLLTFAAGRGTMEHLKVYIAAWTLSLIAAFPIGNVLGAVTRTLGPDRLSGTWRRRFCIASMRASRGQFHFGSYDGPCIFVWGSYRNLSPGSAVDKLGWSGLLASAKQVQLAAEGHLSILGSKPMLDLMAGLTPTDKKPQAETEAVIPRSPRAA